jgi:hypothetical protein
MDNTICKCFVSDTKILMHNGITKSIQDIEVGDHLHNAFTSKPHIVVKLDHGLDILYTVVNKDNCVYTVNGSHILSLKYYKHKTITYIIDKSIYRVSWFDNELISEKTQDFIYSEYNKEIILNKAFEFLKIVNEDLFVYISVKSFIKLKNSIKSKLYGYRASVEFSEIQTRFHPYFLGKWICTTTEKNISGIPNEYKINSKNKRLSLLGGLIDSSGGINRNNEFEFEFYQSLENGDIIDDVMYICRSLGFKCTKSRCTKFDDTWQVTIFGKNIEKIPTLHPDNVIVNKFELDGDSSEITVVKRVRNNYYSIQLANTDETYNRVLLGDFTVA